MGFLVNQSGQLGSFDAFVDLVRVRHPVDQLLRRRQAEQQVSEDLLWAFDEELALPVGRWLKQGRGDRARLGAANQLFGWSPVRAAPVKRIEYDVASAGVIKPLDEFAGGVVNDSRMAARLNLPE
ncbi:MAG TPA: hypothetical protein VME86_02660 [Acidobacteriaceae bacterium]|nr:hypothetical protein [Acidobacteriaceae bacterium]